jgi:hypothetical protein
MPCENRCKHSKCKLKCSDPCIQCRERCEYACEHLKCTNLCFEECNRGPCNQSCKKRLPCGHDCIGYCGEPCPRACRICNKDYVCEIFFGSEDEENARFVLLEDCGHVVERIGMDNWVRSRYEDSNTPQTSNTIQFPECPKCKCPIRLNLRYSKYVKQQVYLIEKIKVKQFGNEAMTQQSRKKLVKTIESFVKSNPDKLNPNQKQTNFDIKFTNKIIIELSNDDQAFSYNQLSAFTNAWNIFERLFKLYEVSRKKLNDPIQLNYLSFEICNLKTYLFDEAKLKIEMNYGQKVNEISYELDRIEDLFKYFQYQSSDLIANDAKLKIAQTLVELESILVKRVNKYKDNVKRECQKKLTQLQGLNLNFKFIKINTVYLYSILNNLKKCIYFKKVL